MGLQPWHIIVVVVVALLLFGGKKLPEAARGLGRSLRIFKSEVSAMNDDKKAADIPSDTPLATPAAQIAPTPVVATPAPLPTPVPAPAAAPIPAPAVTTVKTTPVDPQAT